MKMSKCDALFRKKIFMSKILVHFETCTYSITGGIKSYYFAPKEPVGQVSEFNILVLTQIKSFVDFKK